MPSRTKRKKKAAPDCSEAAFAQVRLVEMKGFEP
ncbi:MAG: hypothetical protein ACI9WU_002050, partial [Myxococcota bacterium]